MIICTKCGCKCENYEKSCHSCGEELEFIEPKKAYFEKNPKTIEYGMGVEAGSFAKGFMLSFFLVTHNKNIGKNTSLLLYFLQKPHRVSSTLRPVGS